MQPLAMRDMQSAAVSPESKAWFGSLQEIVGKEHLLTGFADLLAYSRDRWPHANMRYRFGHLPGHMPLAVALPGSIEEVCAIMRLMHEARQTVIVYGAGSGVLGGTTPLAADVLMLDMKRLNKVLAIDEVSKLATVQGGMNGERFEAYLNNLRFTAGHLPQSLNMSTVGGWVACRGAGQASSRYGKIEDMVAGLKVVLPSGEMVDVRPAPRRATGPGLMDLFVGSEGTLGIIVEATLRIWDYPEKELVYGLGFPDYLSGLEALRRIMQAGYRPSVTRLYDAPEAASRVADHPEYKDHPCLCMLTFGGEAEKAEFEARMCLKIVEDCGGKVCSAEPVHAWLRHRFESLSAKPVSEGKLMDTVEMSAKWSSMPEVYEKTRAAVLSVNPQAHVGAHWSHVYPDGACVYMTFIVPGGDEARAASDQLQIWDALMQACLDAGGSMSHHHGVGLIRSPWMRAEWGDAAMDALQGVKNALDPHHILNPGKLNLR